MHNYFRASGKANLDFALFIMCCFAFCVGLLFHPTEAEAKTAYSGTWIGDSFYVTDEEETTLRDEIALRGRRSLLDSYWQMDRSGIRFQEIYVMYYFSTRYWLEKTVVIDGKSNAEVHFSDGHVETGSCTRYRNIWGCD